jgi:hypothetical protein
MRTGFAAPPGEALAVFRLRLRLLNDEDETSPVRCPFVGLYSLLDGGEPDGFSAAPVEAPHLALRVARGLLVSGATLGEEGEIPPIRAPARLAHGAARSGHRLWLPAAQRHPPQPRLRVVLIEILGCDGVGHPLAVGADPRVRDVPEGEVVLNGDGPWGRHARLGRPRTRCRPHQAPEEDEDAHAARSYRLTGRSKLWSAAAVSAPAFRVVVE